MNTLYVDTTAGALVVSPVNPGRCLPPALTVGDTLPLVLAFLQRNPQPLNTGNPIYNYLDFSSAGVVFSLAPQGAASAGVFSLTFGANTTGALPFNCSSYDLSLALNGLASIIAAGGVTVSGNVGGPFQVRFITNGAQAAMTVGVNGIFPTSSITIATSQTGTAALPACQVVTFTLAAAVQLNTWTPQAAAAVTVTSLNGTVTQRVAIPAGTYGGSFTLTTNGNTTPAIPFAAQLDLVQSLMNALPGVTGCTVSPGQNFWDITIPGWGFAITGNAAGLQIPLTLTGVLVLTAQTVADLLAGQESGQVPFNIQTTTGGVQTVLSGQLTLSQP